MSRIFLLCITLLSFNALANETVTGLTIYPHIGKTTFEEDRFDFDTDNHWGLGVGYRFNGPWALELVFSSLETDAGGTIDGDVDHWRVDALYHIPRRLSGLDKVEPFVSFGFGNADYDSAFFSEKETHLNVGVGAKWKLGQRTSLRGDVKYFNQDNLELAWSIGLEFALGDVKSKPAPRPAAPVEGDADGDGVLDGRDECPNTPAGAEVKSNGCARDDDRDGVPNYKDDCPNTPRGALVNAKGCHSMLEKTVSITLNIEFDYDSAEARSEHTDEVRKVARFMKQYPDSNVVMEGHTDSRGGEAYNQGLSERRAKTIANMLINDFGIEASRISSKGFGESEPIDTNDTAAGRQNNRRVVAVVEGREKEVKMK